MSKNISFISESDLEEKRKQRQEEWNKTRKENDPLEPPEPEYDSRTLYERLQEQKMLKQEEYEESKKLKNLIQGLNNDEIEFLTACEQSKAALEDQKYREELMALEEYKQAVSHLNSEEQERKINEFKRDMFKIYKKKMDKKAIINKKKSQAELISELIKKKSPDSIKKIKTNTGSSSCQPSNSSGSSTSNEELPKANYPPTIQCIGRLPGMGYYGDSDDSSNSDDSFDNKSNPFFDVFYYKLQSECSEHGHHHNHHHHK